MPNLVDTKTSDRERFEPVEEPSPGDRRSLTSLSTGVVPFELSPRGAELVAAAEKEGVA